MSLILAKQRLVVITTHRLSAATVDRIQRDLGSVSRELTDLQTQRAYPRWRYPSLPSRHLWILNDLWHFLKLNSATTTPHLATQDKDPQPRMVQVCPEIAATKCLIGKHFSKSLLSAWNFVDPLHSHYPVKLFFCVAVLVGCFLLPCF